MSASADDSLSETELLGQMTYVCSFAFAVSTLTKHLPYRSLIFAAMDTTSNALSRVFHLLAQHPDIQERLRNELVEAREQSSGTDVPYDTLVHLPYLDAVCRETLRMWVNVLLSTGKCWADICPLGILQSHWLVECRYLSCSTKLLTNGPEM